MVKGFQIRVIVLAILKAAYEYKILYHAEKLIYPIRTHQSSRSSTSGNTHDGTSEFKANRNDNVYTQYMYKTIILFIINLGISMNLNYSFFTLNISATLI